MLSFALTAILCLVLVPTQVVTKAVSKCREPAGFKGFSFELFVNITKAQTYSITPGWYETMEDSNKVPSEYINISRKHYLGNKTCKKQRRKNGKQGLALNNLSQCMWRYVENIDKNRQPETILEADCVCSSPTQARKKSKLICQNVIEYVSVFRKIGCRDNGLFEYQRVWEPRSVACVASALPEPKRLYIIDYKSPI